mmetsp:Transcript_70751/g.229381  ORF Transcript_70751/g.229381 Transcript_70751/m.229381 type:complete len:251 (-) Transcript_70751:74-826(-)
MGRLPLVANFPFGGCRPLCLGPDGLGIAPSYRQAFTRLPEIFIVDFLREQRLVVDRSCQWIGKPQVTDPGRELDVAPGGGEAVAEVGGDPGVEHGVTILLTEEVHAAIPKTLQDLPSTVVRVVALEPADLFMMFVHDAFWSQNEDQQHFPEHVQHGAWIPKGSERHVRLIRNEAVFAQDRAGTHGAAAREHEVQLRDGLLQQADLEDTWPAQRQRRRDQLPSLERLHLRGGIVPERLGRKVALHLQGAGR